MPDNNLGSPQPARTNAVWVLVAVCYLLTMLVLLPWQPGMPAPTVQASWNDAINVATASHLRFGKDLVVDVGPLASALTHQYSPGTDALMLVASWLLSTGVFLGFVLLAMPGRSTGLLVIVPLLLTQFAGREALFAVLPLMLLLAAEKHEWARWHRPLLFLVAAACALLPLVKASLLWPVLLCTLLAVLALWERSPRDALALVVIELLALPAAWVAAGQAVPDLPRYFLSQWTLLGGVAESSASGLPLEDMAVYLGSALLLLCAAQSAAPHPRWRVTVATVAILFFGFRAGFVRHDASALVAAAALVLVAFLLAAHRLTIVTAGGLAVAVAAWVSIVGNHESVDPMDRVERFTQVVVRSLDGLQMRVLQPDGMQAQFRTAQQDIARRQPLPHFAGTADLYPADVSVLLASGATWVPRPVPQSQAAATPALATLNEAHLRWAGPERLYVAVDPADRHYPAFEDGRSWPVLLAHYAPAGIAGNYAVFTRRATPVKVQAGATVFDGSGHLGTPFRLPAAGPLWAEIDVSPTVLGRLAGLVFKLPPLTLVVRYADGSRKTFRFVPSMARAGFLLSPTVSSARDLVALQSAQSKALSGAATPVSFGLRGSTATRLLWNESFDVRIAALHVDPVPEADAVLAKAAEAPAAATPATSH
ncbi:hypothetical protein ACPWT1_09015 [Ramlibacter sp. MMS24-I3-19]|uniref:hypothetical protein n=1 Tax=Ramlibacter sp. MMS24-I3-19 TaxID=3416606 RepID=UPI003CFECFA4